jgi:hypothetical protein
MIPATLPSPSGSPAPTAGAVLTAADVARLPRTLATTDVDYELHDGRLVVTFLPDANHGITQARVLAALSVHEMERGRGRTVGGVAIVLRRSPDHLLYPEGAFLPDAGGLLAHSPAARRRGPGPQ